MRNGRRKKFPIFFVYLINIFYLCYLKRKSMKIKIKRSQLFWLPVYIIILVITGIISLEALGYVFAFGSFLTIAVALDDLVNDNIWIWLMPITWVCMLVGVIGMGLMFLYENSIGKLNAWLDRDKTNKFGDTE